MEISLRSFALLNSTVQITRYITVYMYHDGHFVENENFIGKPINVNGKSFDRLS